MIWLYRLIFLPALLVVVPWFLWRTRGRGDWRRGFRQRLGRFDGLAPRPDGVTRIWVHAVSVGEMLAAVPLVQALRRELGAEIVLTTTTTTGFALAQERLGDVVLGPFFFPLDFAPWSARAWRGIAPDLMVLIEGERWPEHLHQARVRGVPVVCVNARLSERGFRRARLVAPLARSCWRGITRVLAGTAVDAKRFRALGLEPARVRMTGNLKLDVELPRLDAAALSALRDELGLGEGLVIVGASTWPGEEEALLGWWRATRAQGLPAHLVIVPRHVERREAIAALLRDSGGQVHFRSRGAASGDVDVTVVDTTGELRQVLHLADVVFVGRSLPPHRGGQTPIEAAAAGKPVLFGPGMANFREVADSMVAAGAAITVADAGELRRVGNDLLRSEARRKEMAVAALDWIEANRGALARTIAAIREELAVRSGNP